VKKYGVSQGRKTIDNSMTIGRKDEGRLLLAAVKKKLIYVY
jgi:hypothetical protein